MPTTSPMACVLAFYLLLALSYRVLAADPVIPSVPLAFVTTYCSETSSVAGVHVLAESLIRTGHREGLTVFASASTAADELRQLQAIPLVTVVSPPPLRTFCPSSPAHVGECAHLRLALFGAPELPSGANIVFLAHDSVVLSTLHDLTNAAPFSAVRANHADGFDLDTLVLRRDEAVAETLQESFCTTSKDDDEILRDAVPVEVWSPLDDTYGVPAEHLDASWYKQAGMTPKVVCFAHAPRPWKWWASPDRFSLMAGAHWCQAAAHTPYECGWGRSEPPQSNDTVPIPLRAPGQPAGASAALKFGVLLSTYRRPTWRALVRHFQFMKSVSKVVLVWHDPDADPPTADEFGRNVLIARPATDSLNNRFTTPDSGLPEAVYVCDDDMWVMEKSLQHAFSVWRGNSRRLVGLFPRKWGSEEPRYSAKVSEGYNLALTKGVFVHRAFLFMYERLLPGKVKALVNRHKNCEDILMNVMATRYTRMAPLHVMVEEKILDLGHHGGISKSRAHFLTRAQCVEDIANALEINGWNPPITPGSMSVRPLKNREIK